MAVAFDAVGPGAAGTSGTSTPTQWNHTCTGTDLWLVVFLSLDNAATSATVTATYGGNPMTEIGRRASGGGTVGFVIGFKYAASPGTAQVSVSTPSGSNVRTAGSVSFTGASGAGAPVLQDSAGADVTSGSIAVNPTTAGNMVIAGMTCGSGGISFTSGTSRVVTDHGVASGAACDTGIATAASTGSSVSVGWNQNNDFWGAVACEILAATGESLTVTPGSADGTGAAQDATAAAGQATAVLYAGSAAGISGSWSGTGNATGSTQGTYATWTDSAAGSSAVLELSAFGAQSGVPSGSAVTQVNCVVRHGEAPATSVASVTAQAYSGSTPVGSPQPLTAADAVHDDQVTFTGLAYADLADLRVRVTVTRD